MRLVWHYIDDFIFCGSPASTECARTLDSALTACSELGMPVSAHNVEGPATDITVLGIQVNSITQTLSLPDDKLECLQHLLSAWGDKTHSTRYCSRWSAFSITRARSFGRAGLSSNGCSTYSNALSQRQPAKATSLGSTSPSVPTSNGGIRSWQTGTGCLSSQAPSPSPSRWSQMPQAPGGVAPTGTPTGSSSSGQHVPTIIYRNKGASPGGRGSGYVGPIVGSSVESALSLRQPVGCTRHPVLREPPSTYVIRSRKRGPFPQKFIRGYGC